MKLWDNFPCDLFKFLKYLFKSYEYYQHVPFLPFPDDTGAIPDLPLPDVIPLTVLNSANSLLSGQSQHSNDYCGDQSEAVSSSHYPDVIRLTTDTDRSLADAHHQTDSNSASSIYIKIKYQPECKPNFSSDDVNDHFSSRNFPCKAVTSVSLLDNSLTEISVEKLYHHPYGNGQTSFNESTSLQTLPAESSLSDVADRSTDKEKKELEQIGLELRNLADTMTPGNKKVNIWWRRFSSPVPLLLQFISDMLFHFVVTCSLAFKIMHFFTLWFLKHTFKVNKHETLF